MPIKELDIVALLVALPENRLSKGAIGTVVNFHNENFYEVEFADIEGQTYIMLTLPAENLLLFKHEPEVQFHDRSIQQNTFDF